MDFSLVRVELRATNNTSLRVELRAANNTSLRGIELRTLALVSSWRTPYASPTIKPRWYRKDEWTFYPSVQQRPWWSLPIQVSDLVWALFSVAVATRVGNGDDTLFWTGRWLQGNSTTELAPRLSARITKESKSCTVQEAINNNMWVSYFFGSPLSWSDD
jgi:hypothetical protein